MDRGDFSGKRGTGFHVEGSNSGGSEAVRFQGKKNVVVVFYPLDWSPVCTNEHMCFVNDMKNFEKLDAQVLGISVDSVWSHKAFAEKMGIKYPLLADFQPRGAVGDKFGVYMADKGNHWARHRHHQPRETWRGSRVTIFQRCRI